MGKLSFSQRLRGKLGRLYHLPKELRFRNDVFLVYTLGKVGSTTAYETLKRTIPSADVHHVHFLSDLYLNERLPKADAYFRPHIDLGKGILKHLSDHPKKRRRIITLVRDPVERDVSALFQVWKGRFGDRDLDEVSVDEMVDDVKSKLCGYTLEWFDVEFKSFTGIDIYQRPFDREQGYSIFEENGYDVLVLKLEMLDRIADDAFKQFLGVRINEVSNANLSKKKVSHTRHMTLKKAIRFEADELDKVYGSRFAQHFYTPQELEVFRRKWLAGTKDVGTAID